MGYKYGTIRDERPDLIECLANPQDADKYHIGEAHKLDWICPNCGNLVKDKAVNKVVSRGIPCQLCRDGISKPEKIVASALIQTGVNYIAEKTFSWSKRKRYDFYLVDYDIIIEVHGAQHYGYGFKDFSGVSYDEQIKSDEKKKRVAISNGIKGYYSIDASKTKASFIVPQLKQVLNDIGIESDISISKCEEAALTSNVVLAAQLWNEGLMCGEIQRKLELSQSTVVGYLNRAAEIGLCNYDSLYAKQLSQQQAIEKIKRRVRCVETNEVFDSIADARRKYGISNSSNIIRSINNPKCHAGIYNGIKLSWEYV